MKTKLSILAGGLVSAALLYFAFRGRDFGELRLIYRGVNNFFIIPVAAITLLELFLRGLRWKLLLAPAVKVRVWDACRLEAAGLALNNILPLRLGEVMRGAYGAGLFRIPMTTVFATILAERALDSLVLLAMFAAAAAAGAVAGGLLAYSGYFWMLLGGLAAALAALVFIDEIAAHRFFSGFFGRFPRLAGAFVNLALGVRAFHSFKTGFAVVGLAVLQWVMEVFNLYLLALAFGLGDIITPYKGAVLLVAAAAAVSVPGMPGYFGNFEFAVAKVAGMWGVSGEAAFAYAAYIHVLGYLIVTSVGLIFVYQMGHSIGKVWMQFGGKQKQD